MRHASGRGGNPQCTRRRGDPAEGARRDVHCRGSPQYVALVLYLSLALSLFNNADLRTRALPIPMARRVHQRRGRRHFVGEPMSVPHWHRPALSATSWPISADIYLTLSVKTSARDAVVTPLRGPGATRTRTTDVSKGTRAAEIAPHVVSRTAPMACHGRRLRALVPPFANGVAHCADGPSRPLAAGVGTHNTPPLDF
jgi:hypothetical protein